MIPERKVIVAERKIIVALRAFELSGVWRGLTAHETFVGLMTEWCEMSEAEYRRWVRVLDITDAEAEAFDFRELPSIVAAMPLELQQGFTAGVEIGRQARQGDPAS